MARDTRGRFQSKAIGDQLRAAVATVVKATVLKIDTNLRAAPSQGGTPVKTGNAHWNWVPSVGEPHDGTESSEGAHDTGLAAVLAYKLGDGPAYLSNNVPYIQRLNEGSSKQAPALFIEAAVDKANATMQQQFGDRAIKVDGNTGTADRLGARAAENMASAYSPFGDDDD